jgi:hypothetical protein
VLRQPVPKANVLNVANYRVRACGMMPAGWLVRHQPSHALQCARWRQLGAAGTPTHVLHLFGPNMHQGMMSKERDLRTCHTTHSQSVISISGAGSHHRRYVPHPFAGAFAPEPAQEWLSSGLDMRLAARLLAASEPGISRRARALLAGGGRGPLGQLAAAASGAVGAAESLPGGRGPLRRRTVSPARSPVALRDAGPQQALRAAHAAAEARRVLLEVVSSAASLGDAEVAAAALGPHLTPGAALRLCVRAVEAAKQVGVRGSTLSAWFLVCDLDVLVKDVWDHLEPIALEAMWMTLTV